MDEESEDMRVTRMLNAAAKEAYLVSDVLMLARNAPAGTSHTLSAESLELLSDMALGIVAKTERVQIYLEGLGR